MAREQRQNLETIEAELEEVKRKLDRIWHFVESTDLDMADASERILEHRHRRGSNWKPPTRKPGPYCPRGGSSWTAPTPSPPLPRT